MFKLNSITAKIFTLLYFIGVSCVGQTWAADKQTFIFGFGHRLEAAEEAKMYIPFLQYMSKKTGYKFEPRFIQKNENMSDLIGKGEIQFIAIGSVDFIHADEKYGLIPLVRGLNSEKKAEYQSAIITQPDSTIRSIEDIRGKTFAFGSAESTQGHLIPRIMFLKHGIALKDIKEHTYTGSHSKAAEAVYSKKYDAAGLQDTLAKELEKKGLVRIVAMSDFYPSSSIAANKNIDPKVSEAVQKALIDFDPSGKDKEGLYNWDKTEMPKGFIKASASDYKAIREAMIELDFLKKDK